MPVLQVCILQTQLLETALQHIRVENAHDQFFTKRGGQCGQAQFHLIAVRGAGFESSILGPALFRHIHTAQNLDATADGRADLRGQLVHGVEYAIDAKAHTAHFASRFNVNITGALLKGVLQQPIDYFYDVLVVGVRFIHRTKFQHLLQIAEAGRATRPFRDASATHRPRHAVKLAGEPVYLPRVRQHAPYGLAQDVLQIALPGANIGFCAGDHDLMIC